MNKPDKVEIYTRRKLSDSFSKEDEGFGIYRPLVDNTILIGKLFYVISNFLVT
jgi:hypothetical protein